MKLTGAEIFIECLKREGVKTIFALPGGVVLKIFDMLHQQKGIDVILTRHEQGAGHMAEGYAKATGKAGVCLVTFRSGDDQRDHGLGRCLHGFGSSGLFQRAGADEFDRK